MTRGPFGSHSFIPFIASQFITDFGRFGQHRHDTTPVSEDGSAVDVVLYTFQMIDLIHVFILAQHQQGDAVIDGGSEINHQSHIGRRLTGVAILGVIGFAAGHIVEHKHRAVVPLSPITGQHHGNLVFIVGTHGL